MNQSCTYVAMLFVASPARPNGEKQLEI